LALPNRGGRPPGLSPYFFGQRPLTEDVPDIRGGLPFSQSFDRSAIDTPMGREISPQKVVGSGTVDIDIAGGAKARTLPRNLFYEYGMSKQKQMVPAQSGPAEPISPNVGE